MGNYVINIKEMSRYQGPLKKYNSNKTQTISRPKIKTKKGLITYRDL